MKSIVITILLILTSCLGLAQKYDVKEAYLYPNIFYTDPIVSYERITISIDRNHIVFRANSKYYVVELIKRDTLVYKAGYCTRTYSAQLGAEPAILYSTRNKDGRLISMNLVVHGSMMFFIIQYETKYILDEIHRQILQVPYQNIRWVLSSQGDSNRR